MCGVAGIYAHGFAAAPCDLAELRAIRDHMAARGPDGAGEWVSPDGRVALAHRRLAIIDLSEGGAQPMQHGDLTICFNGEIYNYRELRASLEKAGRRFRTGSDTEVILQLYEAEGTAMLGRLRGMFAFALWDARTRSLVLARDPFGIKPLYYADDGRTLRTASQVKALLQGEVDTAPDPAGHAGFFLWGSVPAPHTLYRGIRSLEAGHFLVANEHGVHKPVPYLSITDVLRDAAAHPARVDEPGALAGIAGALRDSVRAHLVADVPVGVFLSSGLDSALLAAIAVQENARPMALTLGFDRHAGTAADETAPAQRLAAGLGLAHRSERIGLADFEADRERLLHAMDQPSIDGINTWFVARAAASQGMKVALSGLGGDELFASYPNFRDLPRLRSAVAPFAALPGLGRLARQLSAPLLGRLTSPKFAGLIEYGGSLSGAYLLRRGLFMPWELPQVMDPDLARAGWEALQTLPRLNATHEGIAGASRDRLAISALEMSWYMRHQLLADADWAGMAHGVEIRVPLVDLPLLRTAAPLLAALPRIEKREVVRAAAPEVPEALLGRPKMGFVVPTREWIAREGQGADRGLRRWARLVGGAFAP